MSTTAKGKIVLQYLDRYPTMPSLTMAKLIFKNLPLEFTGTEEARTIIRYYRGSTGDYNRKKVLNKKHLTGNVYNPFSAIVSDSEDFEPYVLSNKDNNIGIISDLHIPNHRLEPIEIAVKKLKEEKVNTIIINGDLLDNTPFTRHEGKRPSASEVRRWFDLSEMFLEFLRDQFQNCRILWAEGNHDYWYRRWMNQHAWQLDDDPYFSLQERLHLEEYKIEFVPQSQYIMAGKLSIAHGHHVIKGIIAPVNAARGVYTKAKKSMLIGHVHVESSHTETDLHGDIVTTFSTGCLCTLTPEYQPMASKACHGFAHVLTDDDGNFIVKNYRIHKGKLL